MEHQHELDLCGMCCAQPIIKLTAELKRIAPGEVVRIVADKSSMRLDVPAYCKQTGNPLIHHDHANGLLQFWIRRG